MNIFLDIALNLILFILMVYQPTLAVFRTILTNHNGYTIFKNFTTYTYSECYFYCIRTTGCDDVRLLDDNEEKGERRRCLILKLRQKTSGCYGSNTVVNGTSGKGSTSLEPDPKKWKRHVLVGNNERNITKGAVIDTLEHLTKEYMLSFDLKLTQHINADSNILHMTTGDYSGRYQSRTPMIFFSRRFNVRSAVNDAWRYGYTYESEKSKEEEFKLNKWYNIQVKQVRETQDSDDIRYSILLDGNVLQTVINWQPYSFENVMVYLSNPWMDEQPGLVKNFFIYTDRSISLS